MKYFLLTVFLFLNIISANAQCCSAGGGNPVGGGLTEGVLNEHQVELSTQYQYINTDKYLTGTNTEAFATYKFNSNYLHSRIAYGITKNFTMGVEAGYFLNKTQIRQQDGHTYNSSGFNDLIFFPRYNVFNIGNGRKRTELSLGLGIKIPIGKFNDSLMETEPFSGMEYYIKKPLTVQPTSGANDFMFSAFLLRAYPRNNFRLFTHAFYILKGWNAAGEKLGNYASLSIFGSKTIFQNIGLMLQMKGEWIGQMKVNNNIIQYYFLEYDPMATGSKKIFIVPRISYTKNGLSIYAMNEFPLYQEVIKTQIGSKIQASVGMVYRFKIKKADKE